MYTEYMYVLTRLVAAKLYNLSAICFLSWLLAGEYSIGGYTGNVYITYAP